MRELSTRKRMRLENYDYSQNGAYYITICVKDRYEMLGEIDVGAIHNRPHVILSEYGKLVDSSIMQISDYSDTYVDKYVIMPNHVHMILMVNTDGEHGRLRIAPTNISVTVQQLKRRVTKQIGFSIWQKSFHDRIIRDEDDYSRIYQYIDENPAKWQEDRYYVKEM
jgi:REP element-mobilizing transposase RayT